MGKRSYGGDFLARGADTCVYTPPVQCAGPARGAVNPRTRYVSRIARGNLERNIQDRIKRVSAIVDQKVPQYHFPEMLSLYDQECMPLMRAEDLRPRVCDIHGELQSVGEKRGFSNLVTPFAGETLGNTKPERSEVVRVLSFAALMQSALILNYHKIVHGDAHFGNIMWMDQPRNADNSANPHLIFSDWGRTTTYDVFFGNEPAPSREIVTFATYRTGVMYQRTYTQHKYPEKICIDVAARKPAMPELVKRKLFTSLDLLALIGSAERYEAQTGRVITPQHADQLYNLILQNIVDDSITPDAFPGIIRTAIVNHVRGGLRGQYDRNWRYLILAIERDAPAAPALAAPAPVAPAPAAPAPVAQPPPSSIAQAPTRTLVRGGPPADFRQYGFAGAPAPPVPGQMFKGIFGGPLAPAAPAAPVPGQMFKGIFGGRKNSAYKTMKNPFANVMSSVKKTARKVLGLKKRKGGKKTAKVHRRR